MTQGLQIMQHLWPWQLCQWIQSLAILCVYSYPMYALSKNDYSLGESHERKNVGGLTYIILSSTMMHTIFQLTHILYVYNTVLESLPKECLWSIIKNQCDRGTCEIVRKRAPQNHLMMVSLDNNCLFSVWSYMLLPLLNNSFNFLSLMHNFSN